MPRSSKGRHRRQATIGLAALLGVSGITAAAIAMSTGASQAAESCTGLDTALRNNLTFIEGQKANPDAQSAARIANRQSVVDLIQQRRQAAGCTADVVGKAPDQQNGKNGQNCQGNAKDQGSGGNAKGDDKNKQADGMNDAQGMNNGMGANGMNGQGNANGMDNAQGDADRKGMAQDNGKNGKDADKNKDQNGENQNQNGKAGQNGNQCQQGKGAQNGKNGKAQNGKNQNSGQQAGDVVCQGSTVTLSGEGGAPAASSDQFPAGTKLKVTNLDNDKSTTVEVTSVSGSCALLNNAAFEQVAEPGKFLIRNARIERVG
ncbi:hypothetical protein ACFWY9_00525 [Amycolatopsis sp. NPDC059027]|uniref:hypothetical protein n=1 Tax=unclassified Amycolatopsis TaxID=2618356 RepID=UPI00366C61B2